MQSACLAIVLHLIDDLCHSCVCSVDGQDSIDGNICSRASSNKPSYTIPDNFPSMIFVFHFSTVRTKHHRENGATRPLDHPRPWLEKSKPKNPRFYTCTSNRLKPPSPPTADMHLYCTDQLQYMMTPICHWTSVLCLFSLVMPKRPAILLLGDSLTELAFGGAQEDDECAQVYAVGWASLLASTYSRRADVINRGYRGYSTDMFLTILPEILDNDDNDILFCAVFLGANDAVLPSDPRHVELDKFAYNLFKIVQNVQQRFAQTQKEVPPIILLTPPPVDRPAREAFCLENYGDLARAQRTNENAKAYAEKVTEVAMKLGCSVVDVFDRLGGNQGVEAYRDNLVDGLHLTGKGNILVYESLMQVIEKELPHVAPMKDGQGKYGTVGVPLEHKLWNEFERNK